MRLVSRREALTLATGIAAVAFATVDQSSATPSDAAAEITKFTGGVAPEPSKISIELPEIAENGNSIPLSIDIDHPMTPENFVTDVLVVADNNPAPRVAAFRFTRLTGRAEVATRIRLAGTQTIFVVAKTNDGKFFAAQKQVKVTIGGCGG